MLRFDQTLPLEEGEVLLQLESVRFIPVGIADKYADWLFHDDGQSP